MRPQRHVIAYIHSPPSFALALPHSLYWCGTCRFCLLNGLFVGRAHACRQSTQGKRFHRINQTGDAQGRSLSARSRLAGHASGRQARRHHRRRQCAHAQLCTGGGIVVHPQARAGCSGPWRRDRLRGRHGSRPRELLCGCGAARGAQRAFGRGLHVHPLGRGSDPRPLCLLRRPGRAHGKRGAGQARLRDQTRAATVPAGRRPALVRPTCPHRLRASSFGCGGYSRSRCAPCSNRAPRCRSR